MKSFQILIVSFSILVNSINIAFCQDITLSWDPSPTQEVTGYKVYYQQENMDFPFEGTDADEGDSPVDVGDVLSTTLTNLSDGVTYFFSVTAYADNAYESYYSNIVSNSWIPALIIPATDANNESVPVTFQWETAPPGYNVTYTLIYGTDQNEVTDASVIAPLPPLTGGNQIPTGVFYSLAALLMIVMFYQTSPRLKILPQIAGFLFIVLLGGILTACGGGGGGGSSSSDHSAADPTTSQPESVLYSINKGSSDYHQAFSPEVAGSTTYYWKVIATDSQDPNLTYKSEVKRFTTEEF